MSLHFKGMPDLETLNIANNQLTQLDFSQFVGMSALVTIHTSDNNWNCTCQMKIELTQMIARIHKTVSCERDYFCMQCSSPKTLKDSFLHTVLKNNCTGNSTYAVTERIIHFTSGSANLFNICEFLACVITLLSISYLF